MKRYRSEHSADSAHAAVEKRCDWICMQLPGTVLTEKEVLMKRWRPNECRSQHSHFFTWASLEKWPWILRRDDTVTASLRAPLKDSSPCQKPPPLHAQPTVWGPMGQVVLNQHFKDAPLSIIRGCVPSSLRTGQCVERLRMTSPSLGLCCRHGWRRKETQRELDFYILYFLFLWSLCCKNPPRCLFAIKERLRSNSHPGRHSCVEYNLKFHHSVWSHVLCFFFPLAPDVIWIPYVKIVLNLLCTLRGQSVCFAARL